MKNTSRFFAVALAVLLFNQTQSMAQEVQVPAALKGWESWVKAKEPHSKCPAQSADGCVWSSAADAVVAAGSARLTWHSENLSSKPGKVWLPSAGRSWPESVSMGGKPAAVQFGQGPGGVAGYVELAGGAKAEFVAVLNFTGDEPLIPGMSLGLVRGAGVISSGRSLALGVKREEPAAEVKKEAPGKATARIGRLVEDGQIPTMRVWVRVENPGPPSRAQVLGLLPEGSEPVAFSGMGGAGWENGRLVATLPRGRSEFVLTGRLPTDLSKLKTTVPSSKELDFEGQETWSVDTRPGLRNLSVDGKRADPAAAGVMSGWVAHPAWLVPLGGGPKFTVEKRVDDRPMRKTQAQALFARVDLSGNGWTLEQKSRIDSKVSGVLTVGEGFDLTHAKNEAGTHLPVFETPGGKAVPHGPGLVSADVFARKEGLGFRMDIPATVAQGSDSSGIHVPVVVALPGGWKTLWVGGSANGPGLFKAPGLWDWFVMALAVWAGSAALGYAAGAVAGLAMLFGLLYAGAPFAPVLPFVALVLLGKKTEGGRLARVAGVMAAAGGGWLALSLIPFTAERFFATIHPGMDVLGQPLAVDQGTLRAAEQVFGAGRSFVSSVGGGVLSGGLSMVGAAVSAVVGLAVFVLVAGALFWVGRGLIRRMFGPSAFSGWKKFAWLALAVIFVGPPVGALMSALSGSMRGQNVGHKQAGGYQAPMPAAPAAVTAKRADRARANEAALGEAQNAMSDKDSSDAPTMAQVQGGAVAGSESEASKSVDSLSRMSKKKEDAAAERKVAREEPWGEAAGAGGGEPSWRWGALSFTLLPGEAQAVVWLMPPWASRLAGLLVAAGLWWLLVRGWGGALRSAKDAGRDALDLLRQEAVKSRQEEDRLRQEKEKAGRVGAEVGAEVVAPSGQGDGAESDKAYPQAGQGDAK